MGGKVTKESTSSDIAEALEELGAAYAGYKENILAEGIDGEVVFSFLQQENGVEVLLSSANMTNALHKTKISNQLLKIKEKTQVCDVTPSPSTTSNSNSTAFSPPPERLSGPALVSITNRMETGRKSTLDALLASGSTLADLKDIGFSCADFKNADIPAGVVKASYVYNYLKLKHVGFTPAEMRAGGYTAAEMRAAGFSPASLKAAGFTSSELNESA
eukprot:gene40673-49589_t